MILWRGIELVGCTPKSSSKPTVLSGCIDVFDKVDKTSVTMRIHDMFSTATKSNQPHIHAALKDGPLSPAKLARVASEGLLSNLMSHMLGVTRITRWHAFAYICHGTLDPYGHKLCSIKGNLMRIWKIQKYQILYPRSGGSMRIAPFDICEVLFLHKAQPFGIVTSCSLILAKTTLRSGI